MEFRDPVESLPRNLLGRLSTLEWLISPQNERMGRTTTLIAAFLRQSLKNPNRDINIFDHAGTAQMNRRIHEQICDRIRQMNGDFDVQLSSIKYRGDVSVFALLESGDVKRDIQTFKMMASTLMLGYGFDKEALLEFLQEVVDEKETESIVKA